MRVKCSLPEEAECLVPITGNENSLQNISLFFFPQSVSDNRYRHLIFKEEKLGKIQKPTFEKRDS